MPARNIRPWLWLAGLIILLDQASKWIALGTMQPGESRYVTAFFNWVLTFNSGAAFSFLSDAGGWQRWFFTILALGISGWIITMLRRHTGELRHLVSKQMTLKFTPELRFRLDETFDRMDETRRLFSDEKVMRDVAARDDDAEPEA